MTTVPCDSVCVSSIREQKTLDLENRARYTALQRRWVVLDKTVTFPDDEPVGDSQDYLELSEGEDDDDESRGKVVRDGLYSVILGR